MRGFSGLTVIFFGDCEEDDLLLGQAIIHRSFGQK